MLTPIWYDPTGRGPELITATDGTPSNPYYRWGTTVETWERILTLPRRLRSRMEAIFARALNEQRAEAEIDLARGEEIQRQFNIALRYLIQVEHALGSTPDLAPASMRRTVQRLRDQAEEEQFKRIEGEEPENGSVEAFEAAAEAVTEFDGWAQRASATALDYEVGISVGRTLDYKSLGGETWRDWCDRHGLDPKRPSSYEKMVDPQWWRRRLRKTHVRTAENAFIKALAFDPEGHTRSPWVSDEALYRGRAQDAVMKVVGARTMGESSDGITVTCAQLYDREERNKRQYAELMARCSGLKALAEERGDTYPILVTITAPSRFHPTTTWHPHSGRGLRRRNPAWDGSTPRDTHAWMQDNWEEFCDLKRYGDVAPYWVMGVQPQIDETPHYHVVMYVRDEEEAGWVERSLRTCFEAENAHSIDVQAIAGGTDGAVRYSARTIAYISREVAEKHPGSDDPDHAGDEAERASEWARVWGIRRFRTSHSRSTLWKLLRRSDISVDPNGQAHTAQQSARAGDFASFLHASANLKLSYEHTITRYGDKTRKVIGFCDTINGVLYEPEREWKWMRTPIPVPISELCLTTKGKAEGSGTGLAAASNLGAPLPRARGDPAQPPPRSAPRCPKSPRVGCLCPLNTWSCRGG